MLNFSRAVPSVHLTHGERPTVGQLVAGVPYQQLAAIRAFDANTTNADMHKALDSIGIGVVAALVSDGFFIDEVANALDIPTYVLIEWCEADAARAEQMNKAYDAAGFYYARLGRSVLETTKQIDRIEKDMLKARSEYYKWLASVFNTSRFGNKTSVGGSGNGSFQFIFMDAPAMPKVIGGSIA